MGVRLLIDYCFDPARDGLAIGIGFGRKIIFVGDEGVEVEVPVYCA